MFFGKMFFGVAAACLGFAGIAGGAEADWEKLVGSLSPEISVKSDDGGLSPEVSVEKIASGKIFAWRFSVKGARGDEVWRVTGERGGFVLPRGANVWAAERPNGWKLKSHAGEWLRIAGDKLPSFSPVGPVWGLPLVVENPEGGFTVLAQAGLTNYSGMRLKAVEADGRMELCPDFTEGAKGFVVKGDFVTPWRVAVFAENLQELTEVGKILEELSPEADGGLFADRSWIRAGRVAWRWWSSGTGNFEEERGMVDCAAALTFEFSLVDEGWLQWPEAWARVRELVDYGKKKGVGILLWARSGELADAEDDYRVLREFLDKVAASGAVGVKADFFDSEAKEKIDLQEAFLRETARRRLMVFFHGCQPPSGEKKTWPHEMTREGIRGLELNRMKEGPVTAGHNCALPFTRLATGHGDYTPLGFSRPGGTTWAHQLATAAAFNSEFQVIAENPKFLLEDERARVALDLIRALPTVWDETRVLPGSEIGECVALARRKGGDWWVAVLTNGARRVEVDFGFLGAGDWRGVLVKSGDKVPLAREELRVGSGDKLPLVLGKADGAVVWLRRGE